MPATPQPKFGPYIYGDHDADVEEWTDGIDVRGIISPVPRSDIARQLDGFLAPRRVRVRGTIGNGAWTTRDQLRAAVDAFNWAHRPGQRTLWRDTDRYLTVEVRQVKFDSDTGLLYSPYTIEFEAGDPHYYATAPTVDTWNAPATGNTRPVTPTGAATAAPTFTFTFAGAGTAAIAFYNDTRGEGFTLAGAVAAADVLAVNCLAQTVTLNGANRMSYFGGRFPLLDPVANTLRIVFTGPGLTSVVTTWVDRWL